MRSCLYHEHENIAWALEEIRDPDSVPYLYKGVLLEFDEYRIYNDEDSMTFAVKCLFALHEIDTEDAREKLKLLTNHDNEAISHRAKRLLEDGDRGPMP